MAPFDIYLNTGSGESQVANDVVVSTGFSPVSITTSSFPFTASGPDVVMRLDGAIAQFSPAIPVFLNGFTVIAVPEPTSGLLLVLGVLPLVYRRFRRKTSNGNGPACKGRRPERQGSRPAGV